MVDPKKRKEGFTRKVSRYWGVVICMTCVLCLLWASPLQATDPKLTVNGPGAMNTVKPGGTLTFSAMIYERRYLCPAFASQPATYWPAYYGILCEKLGRILDSPLLETIRPCAGS